MSRKWRLVLFTGIIWLIIAYLAYDYHCYIEGDLSGFLTVYLANTQKYFFLISIFFTLVLLCIIVPVSEPMVILRLNDKLYQYLLKLGVVYSLYGSIVILLGFFVSGIVMGVKFSIEPVLLGMIVRLFLFLFVFYTLSMCLYLKSGRWVFSVLCILVCHFLVTAFYTGINFFVYNNEMGEWIKKLILEGYLFVGLLFGLIYLYVRVGKMECLLLEKQDTGSFFS